MQRLDQAQLAQLAPPTERKPLGRVRRFLSRVAVALTGRVWIVGRVEGAGIRNILGAFCTESEASARCRTPFDVIGPVVVGEDLPEVSSAWAGMRYPVAERLAELRSYRDAIAAQAANVPQEETHDPEQHQQPD